MAKKSVENNVEKSRKDKAESAPSHDWIKKHLKAVGKTQKEIAKVLKLQPTRLNERINGKTDFEPREIPALARELKLPFSVVFARLTGMSSEEIPDDMMLLEIRGEANAGHWAKTKEWPADVWEYIMVPKDAEYGSVAYGLRVTGEDMNELYPPDRSIVVCVPYAQYKEPVRDGDYVVVQRADGNGQYETTVKQVSVQDGRVWLRPQTDNAAYKPIELTKTNGSGEYYGTQELGIVAVVLRAVIDLPPPQTARESRKTLPEAL